MFQNSADRMHGGFRHARVALAGKQVLVPFPQRKVHMHATAVVAEERLGHKGRRLVIFARHVLDNIFVLKHGVGHVHQGPKAHVNFALTSRGHFVMLALDGNADPFQGQHHFTADILERVRWGHGEITFLVPDFVARIWVFDPAAIPLSFVRVNVVITLVCILIEAHIVKNKEFRLGPDVPDVGQAGALEIGFRLAGDIAGVVACNSRR